MSRKKKPSKPVPYKPLEETYSPVLTVKEKPLSVGRSRGGMTYNNAMLQLTAAVSFGGGTWLTRKPLSLEEEEAERGQE